MHNDLLIDQHFICMTANLPQSCEPLGYKRAIILGGHDYSQAATTAASHLPALVFLELVLARAVEELLEADESILVLVHLVHDVLPHAVHLLVPLHHVVLRRFRVVRLVQLAHPTPHTHSMVQQGSRGQQTLPSAFIPHAAGHQSMAGAPHVIIANMVKQRGATW